MYSFSAKKKDRPPLGFDPGSHEQRSLGVTLETLTPSTGSSSSQICWIGFRTNVNFISASPCRNRVRYSYKSERRYFVFTFFLSNSCSLLLKLKQRGYFFETRLLAPFKNAFLFLTFLDTAPWGKQEPLERAFLIAATGLFLLERTFFCRLSH